VVEGRSALSAWSSALASATSRSAWARRATQRATTREAVPTRRSVARAWRSRRQWSSRRRGWRPGPLAGPPTRPRPLLRWHGPGHWPSADIAPGLGGLGLSHCSSELRHPLAGIGSGHRITAGHGPPRCRTGRPQLDRGRPQSLGHRLRSAEICPTQPPPPGPPDARRAPRRATRGPPVEQRRPAPTRPGVAASRRGHRADRVGVVGDPERLPVAGHDAGPPAPVSGVWVIGADRAQLGAHGGGRPDTVAPSTPLRSSMAATT